MNNNPENQKDKLAPQAGSASKIQTTNTLNGMPDNVLIQILLHCTANTLLPYREVNKRGRVVATEVLFGQTSEGAHECQIGLLEQALINPTSPLNNLVRDLPGLFMERFRDKHTSPYEQFLILMVLGRADNPNFMIRYNPSKWSHHEGITQDEIKILSMLKKLGSCQTLETLLRRDRLRSFMVKASTYDEKSHQSEFLIEELKEVLLEICEDTDINPVTLKTFIQIFNHIFTNLSPIHCLSLYTFFTEDEIEFPLKPQLTSSRISSLKYLLVRKMGGQAILRWNHTSDWPFNQLILEQLSEESILEILNSLASPTLNHGEDYLPTLHFIVPRLKMGNRLSVIEKFLKQISPFLDIRSNSIFFYHLLRDFCVDYLDSEHIIKLHITLSDTSDENLTSQLKIFRLLMMCHLVDIPKDILNQYDDEQLKYIYSSRFAFGHPVPDPNAVIDRARLETPGASIRFNIPGLIHQLKYNLSPKNQVFIIQGLLNHLKAANDTQSISLESFIHALVTILPYQPYFNDSQERQFMIFCSAVLPVTDFLEFKNQTPALIQGILTHYSCFTPYAKVQILKLLRDKEFIKVYLNDLNHLSIIMKNPELSTPEMLDTLHQNLPEGLGQGLVGRFLTLNYHSKYIPFPLN